MKHGDKVFVVDGTRLRMTRFVRAYSSGRLLVQYHFDAAGPTWVVDAADVSTSEEAARDRLAAVVADKVKKLEQSIARLRSIDPLTAPVLVRSLAKKPKTLTAIAGGGQ